METIVSALVVIFIILFAALTLSHAFVSSQMTLQATWQEAQTLDNTRSQTRLTSIEAQTRSGGTVIVWTILNSGGVKVADFEQWDTILQYYDNSNAYHIEWLPYSANSPGSNEWTVKSIFADSERQISEGYERGIFNPGESMVIEIGLPTAIQAATQAQITLATGGGAPLSTIFVRNTPPVLAVNAGLTMAVNSEKGIEESSLQVTDVDNPAAELRYTLLATPEYGSLSLTSFSQQDIAEGALTYSHSGSEDDAFSFTVSDGQDEIGPYTFTITVSEPPTLTTNAGLTLTAPDMAIDGARLAASDPDDNPANLVYTITALPTQGSLTQTTFTQDDINNGAFRYIHVGAGPDQFAFTVTDGETTIGPYTFVITPA